MPLRVGLALCLSLGLGLLWPGEAAADPLRGTGRAKSSQGQKVALSRAREAALRAAISKVAGAGAPEPAAILREVEAWTGAYRVVHERIVGDAIEVEVEVQIDVARLRKRMQGGSSPDLTARFRWEGVAAQDGCPRPDVSAIEETLALHRVTGKDGRTPITWFVECSEMGAVDFTHLHAAKVLVRAGAEGKPLAEHQAVGFGASPAAAMEDALSAANARVMTRVLEVGAGLVRVRIREPWPARRVKSIEKALVEAVVGVRGVELVGISAAGQVELHVFTDLEAEALGARLVEVNIPGFTLSVYRVEGPHALILSTR